MSYTIVHDNFQNSQIDKVPHHKQSRNILSDQIFLLWTDKKYMAVAYRVEGALVDDLLLGQVEASLYSV